MQKTIEGQLVSIYAVHYLKSFSTTLKQRIFIKYKRVFQTSMVIPFHSFKQSLKVVTVPFPPTSGGGRGQDFVAEY